MMSHLYPVISSPIGRKKWHEAKCFSDHDFATDRGSVPFVFDLARFEEVNEEGGLEHGDTNT